MQVTEYSVVPEPVYITQKARSFPLTPKTRLCFVNLGQNTPTAKYISNSLRQMHIRPAFIGQPEKDCITITLNDTTNPAIGREGYLLQVKPEGIFISANTEAGLFYAFQTFLQMVPANLHQGTFRRIIMPECTILDYPRFPWRGSHLDVCRHFFTVKEIKKHLDLMAAYKFNKFHFHLTDDQGWRIEIDQYPALNDIGSWRVDRSQYPWGCEPPARVGEEPTYGGYYTKKQITEIVEYAAQRHIEVIPEIELPGHCSPILAAYPEMSCSHKPHAVSLGPCSGEDANLCVGNPDVLTFICNVLDEVSELFPSEYIHIGGAADPTTWQHCPRCLAAVNNNNLSNIADLQGWFISQVEAHLTSKGKRIIGWGGLTDYSNLSSEAVVMTSRGDSSVAATAIRGNAVISVAPQYCNLSYYQTDSLYHPRAIPITTTLSQVYQFDPIPHGLTSDAQPFVWGGEAILWTDHILHYSQAEYFLLPRLCALAECLWSQSEVKNWEHFRHKIEHQKELLSINGYAGCKGSFKPIITLSRPVGEKNIEVTMTSEVEGTYIYYTLDGSNPTPESNIYTTPFLVPKGTKIRTISYYNGEAQEGIYEQVVITD